MHACAQAPVKPKSAVGEMLAYYYQAQPHLFKEVIERQFAVLAEERDAKEAAEREQREASEEAEGKAATSSMDLTLYRHARPTSARRRSYRALYPSTSCSRDRPWISLIQTVCAPRVMSA